jgi:aerobic carbon-monoxide dehydrogenase small subunit
MSGPAPDRRLDVEMTVNGRPVTLRFVPEALLLDMLREDLGLTGSKRSCDVQVCGACTVLLDGLPVSACSVLAYEARGRAVLTIEGLANGERLHPVQEAFLAAAAFQCGFCTPGMIMAVTAMLAESPTVTPGEARERLRGNICRCTGYVSILAAVAAAQRMSGTGGPEMAASPPTARAAPAKP